MKTVFLIIMIISGIVAGVSAGCVSARLKKFVYLDDVLIKEAKLGKVDAIWGLSANFVMIISFLVWFYISINEGR